MGIGKRIGTICAQHGMSIRQLAIKAGVPYTTLYSAVKRDSDGMDFETLKRVANALDVDAMDLIFDMNEFCEKAADHLLDLPPEQLQERINDIKQTELAEKKLITFYNAASLAGFVIDWSGVPVKIFDASSGEQIAENISPDEFGNAVNELISYAGILCLKMSDLYKKYGNASSEESQNSEKQTKDNTSTEEK